jgi:hypothetical protein
LPFTRSLALGTLALQLRVEELAVRGHLEGGHTSNLPIDGRARKLLRKSGLQKREGRSVASGATVFDVHLERREEASISLRWLRSLGGVFGRLLYLERRRLR